MDISSIQFVVDSALDGNRTTIPYRKAFRRITGSVTASILLQQIYYRWKSVGCQPFWKFKLPCKHADYREMDSWIEELGFTESEFNGAIMRIGTKVNTKREIYSALRKKDAKHLVIYYTDKATNLTWYYLNFDLFYKLTFAALKNESDDINQAQKTAESKRSGRDEIYESLMLQGFTDTTSQIVNCQSLNSQLPVDKLSTPYYTERTHRILTKSGTPDESGSETAFGGETYEAKKNVKDANDLDVKGQVHRTKTETPKQLSFDQVQAVKDSAAGQKMPVDFVLSYGIIQEALDSGYELDDIEREFASFSYHYTTGKGRRRKSLDWNKHFLHKWLADSFSYGKIKRNGQYNGTNASEERLQSIQRTAKRVFGNGGDSLRDRSLEDLLRSSGGNRS